MKKNDIPLSDLNKKLSEGWKRLSNEEKELWNLWAKEKSNKEILNIKYYPNYGPGDDNYHFDEENILISFLNLQELKEFAKALEIRDYNKMKKGVLIGEIFKKRTTGKKKSYEEEEII